MGDKYKLSEILQKHQIYVHEKLLTYLKNVNELVEGNIISIHTQKYNLDHRLILKRINIVNLILNLKEDLKVMEIGFNTGYSALLMLMSNPNINLTCVDINSHSYVKPCFNIIKNDYNLDIILENSEIALRMMIAQGSKFDLIHIDGSHLENVVRDDLINSLKLSNVGTIIIFDDTHDPIIDKICDEYIEKGFWKEYDFPNKVITLLYEHRIMEVIKL